MKDVLFKSIEEIAPSIENKEISPVELTKLVLDHAEQFNDKVNAYITITRKEAEEAAEKAEQEIMNGVYRGKYHGIPIGIKDNIYIKENISTIGSKIHQYFVPDHDAKVIEKLRDAGAIFTGKLNMHEYAWSITNNNPHYGAVHNPWDLGRIPGGSSGGSGAAVAAHMAFAALGTDTGGSIRIPASACGIVGLKPTYGRVSNTGSFPLASTLDHIGPMTKTVKDAALMLDIIAETGQGTFTQGLSGDVKGLKIGIYEDFFFDQVNPEIESIVHGVIEHLVKEGAELTTFDLPSIDKLKWAQSIILRSEFAGLHRENRMQRPTDFGKDIQDEIKEELPTVVDYLHALEIKKCLKEECKALFKEVDVIISPTLAVIPPVIGESRIQLAGKEVSLFDGLLRFTNFSNITGLPAISIPCGLSEGMPVGLQIIGAYFEEATVLNTAYAVEKMNLIHQRPKLLEENL